MLLTLEVVSSNGAALGANRRKTVGPEGAQIGRAKENDWVILDQYISRVNARIRYTNGAFFVEGLGRNPLAMYEANNTVENGQLHPLRDGDRFFLDQYEIRATISAGQTEANGLMDDPFAAAAPVVVPSSRPSNVGLGDVLIGDDGSSASGNLDPLAVLIGGGAKPMPPPQHVDLDHVPVFQEPFNAPRPITNAPPVSGIPDDWLTEPQRPPVRAPEPPRRPPTVIPDTWDRTGFTQLEQVQPAGAPQTGFSVNDSTIVEDVLVDPTDPFGQPGKVPRVEPPQAPPVRPRPMPPQRPALDATQAHYPPQPQAMPPHSAPAHTPQPPATDGSSSLGHLLQAAGLPSAQMTPEIAAEIGEALRIVVQGVMDVLHSRAEIKSELRMAMTRMQSQENNPLKFSPNVEAALHTLLVERNRGYLPTVRAFDEAFNDIRNHQIAVLQGIRVAFESLLGQFKPEYIEAQMEAQGRRGGLLGLTAKARFRDYYGELFEQLTHDPEASFRRLFGEPFAQAYEAQMEHLTLKTGRGKRRE